MKCQTELKTVDSSITDPHLLNFRLTGSPKILAMREFLHKNKFQRTKMSILSILRKKFRKKFRKNHFSIFSWSSSSGVVLHIISACTYLEHRSRLPGIVYYHFFLL